MHLPIRTARLSLPALAVTGALVIAACGGYGGGQKPAAHTTQQATHTATQMATPKPAAPAKPATATPPTTPAAPAKPAAPPKPAPVSKPKPASGIPQNNGGDGDPDNNGAVSDGDGNL
jgi:hypothetical protein